MEHHSNQNQHRFLQTLKHAVNYFGAGLAIAFLEVISLPIMTRLLNPHEYGVMSIFNAFVGILIVVTTLNTYSSVGRYYYEEKEDFNEFFGTSVVLTIACLFVFSVFFFLFNTQMANLAELPVQVMVFLIPVIICQVAASFFEQIFQARRESKKIATRRVLQAVATFLLSILLIVSLKDDRYLGPIWGQLIIGLIFLVFYVTQLKPFFKISFNLKMVKYILSYSIPFMPYVLSFAILAQIDRVMINYYFGLSEAGLYSFSVNIGLLLALFYGALFQAWIPQYFRLMKCNDHEKLNDDINTMFHLILIAAIGLLFFGNEIGTILGNKNFHGALQIIPIVIIGYVFSSIFSIYTWGFGYINRTIFSSIVVVLASIVNIVLNVIFIPILGNIGAAASTTVSFFIMALLAYVFNRYILEYSTPIKIIIKPLSIITPFIGFYFIIINLPISYLLFLVLKIIAFCAAGLILAYAGFSIKISTLLRHLSSAVKKNNYTQI